MPDDVNCYLMKICFNSTKPSTDYNAQITPNNPCISDHLGQSWFFPFRKFFSRNFCVSDVNEARGDAQRRPKKSFSKTPGKHFSMHFWSFGTKLIFSPLEKIFPDIYASRTLMRRVATPNDVRKKVSQKHLENTFLCISDHLGQSFWGKTGWLPLIYTSLTTLKVP